jgi:hypothetical protein
MTHPLDREIFSFLLITVIKGPAPQTMQLGAGLESVE